MNARNFSTSPTVHRRFYSFIVRAQQEFALDMSYDYLHNSTIKILISKRKMWPIRKVIKQCIKNSLIDYHSFEHGIRCYNCWDYALG